MRTTADEYMDRAREHIEKARKEVAAVLLGRRTMHGAINAPKVLFIFLLCGCYAQTCPPGETEWTCNVHITPGLMCGCQPWITPVTVCASSPSVATFRIAQQLDPLVNSGYYSGYGFHGCQPGPIAPPLGPQEAGCDPAWEDCSCQC